MTEVVSQHTQFAEVQRELRAVIVLEVRSMAKQSSICTQSQTQLLTIESSPVRLIY